MSFPHENEHGGEPGTELSDDQNHGESTGAGEAEGRERGFEDGGGRRGNVPLEDGQRRGVDADGQITQGTHGGPAKRKPKSRPTGAS